MKESLRLCNTRHYPDLQAAYDAALKENPANAAFTPSYLTEGQQTSDRQGRIVTAFTKYWARGRTLRVRFIEPVPAFLQQLFFDAASKWLPHVNLKFELVTSGDAEIRISLNQASHWSAVGTDALLAFKLQGIPTMGFDLTRLVDSQKLIRLQGRSLPGFDLRTVLARDFDCIVLHEFGHALGAEHEHQHPDAHIPWNVHAVLKEYQAAGHSADYVRRNVLDRYEAADYSYSPYDPHSVMHYNVPQNLTEGDFEIDNTSNKLSTKDIEFMSMIYGDRPNSRKPFD